MPRYSHLFLSMLTTVFLSQGLALSASAADQNTYRPGQAYLKTAGQSHQVCAQQCQGDAQCRGWNFVRPNPRAATGICEFNARAAQPVASAISISGEVTTSVDPMMSRAIPAGTNTRRVGTPTIETRKKVAPTKRPTRVRRMPVPTPQNSLKPTNHTRPTATQRNTRQPVYSSVPKPAPAQDMRQQPSNGQFLSPQQQQYRQQFMAKRQYQEQMRARQQPALPQQRKQRPQLARPAMNAPRAAPEVNRPQYGPQPMQAAPIPQAQAPQPQSLFGSLHDDLTKDFTPVARPKTAPDNLNNPDAPVSTSRAAPAKAVETAPLRNPVIPGLAGAEQ